MGTLVTFWQLLMATPTRQLGKRVGLLLLSGGMAIAPIPGYTVQLADGTVWFERPPSLADTVTTRNGAFASRPTYYFTLAMPPNAGEPLGRIQVTQRDFTTAGGQVRYDLGDTVAFLGTRGDRGQSLRLRSVQFDPEQSTVQVDLLDPVPPDSTVTLALRPYRNPRYGGVYLFGVTAFPVGDQAHGQFLGYGRLHFYDRRDGPWYRFH